MVAVNVPDAQDQIERQIGHKPGTVGHPIPGVAAKVVDLDTGEPLPYNQEGLLLVKGPNRMAGYLGQPEQTQEVIAGRLVCDRATSPHRRRRLHSHHRPALPVQQDRRGDGPASADRRGAPARSSETAVALSSPSPTNRKASAWWFSIRSRTSAPRRCGRDSPARSCRSSGFPSGTASTLSRRFPATGTGKLDLFRLKTLAMKLASAATPANSDEAS